MSQEVPAFIDIPSNLPEDVTEVLKDGKWHAAMSSPRHMSLGDYSPLRFWINGTAEDLLGKLEYPSSGQCYRMEFVRNQGSWGREEGDLFCEGKAVIGDKELPVSLVTMNTVVFFQAIK